MIIQMKATVGTLFLEFYKRIIGFFKTCFELEGLWRD